MQDNADKINFSYEVDRNLVLLFDLITMVNAYITLPEKYSTLLTELEIELCDKVFKRPLLNESIVLVSEKYTVTDIREKENVNLCEKMK